MEKESIKSIKKEKVPFDKKKWREKKYSKKAKVEQWKAQNQQKLKRDYFKMLKKEGMNPSNANLTPIGQKKPNYKAIREGFEKRKLAAERKAQKDEKRRQQEEKKKAIEEYKKKKANKFKVLSQKTKRGQPVMRGRLELLYEKIKKNYGDDGGTPSSKS